MRNIDRDKWAVQAASAVSDDSRRARIRYDRFDRYRSRQIRSIRCQERLDREVRRELHTKVKLADDSARALGAFRDAAGLVGLNLRGLLIFPLNRVVHFAPVNRDFPRRVDAQAGPDRRGRRRS